VAFSTARRISSIRRSSEEVAEALGTASGGGAALDDAGGVFVAGTGGRHPPGGTRATAQAGSFGADVEGAAATRGTRGAADAAGSPESVAALGIGGGGAGAATAAAVSGARERTPAANPAAPATASSAPTSRGMPLLRRGPVSASSDGGTSSGVAGNGM
jgi:hypothetical protein